MSVGYDRYSSVEHVFIERSAKIPVVFPRSKPGLRGRSAEPLNCYPPSVHAYALNAERCVCGDTERPKRSP